MLPRAFGTLDANGSRERTFLPRWLWLVARVVFGGMIASGVLAVAVFAGRAGSISFRVFPARRPPGGYEPRADPKLEAPDAKALDDFRADAISRAQVWRLPSRPIPKFDFSQNVDDAFSVGQVLSCQYLFEDSKGWTPKFDCILPDGEVVRVKYGRGNGEVFAEVIATRLLTAVGFGADRVSVVRLVRCFGCPPYPYPRWGEIWNRVLSARGGYREFEPAVVERSFGGTPIASSTGKGWSWAELDLMEPEHGGASRAERDALRLMAVFLAHWDNKSENQRLVCLDEPRKIEDGCRRPFAYIQDTGSSFGPRRVNVREWRATPVWADASRCQLSLERMPFLGGTFEPVAITERGRRFLAERLGAISRAQARQLFASVRLDEYTDIAEEDRDPERWAEAFEFRVKQIVDAASCPTP